MLVVSRAFVAVRVLHYVAARPDDVARKTEIAAAISVPVPYTGRVARELLLAGFLKSVRGSQGGYALALPAASIRVGDVVQFVEHTRSWRTRSKLDEVGLRDALQEAQDKFFDVLNECSIADLCVYENSREQKSEATTISSKAPVYESRVFC